MKGWKPLIEAPAFLAAALLCAWISNALAGPTRRLAWRPEAPTALPAPASASVPASAPETVPRPAPIPVAPPKAAPKPTKVAAPKPAATADWDPAALLARFPPLQGQVYAEISGDEARWLQRHGALILDARRTAAFVEGHLPGAKSLSLWEDGLPAKIAALKGDPTLPTVVYCAGGDCEDSHLLAQKLWLAGYRNLRVYAGGYPDWVGNGWPTGKGTAP